MTVDRTARTVASALDLIEGRPVLALTGAGMSTDSGIPDYRGPHAPARTPMTYQEFVSGPLPRQRYWARAHLGWSRMRRAEPNAGHDALAILEAAGPVRMVITQNVDGLHEAAGSVNLCALHGRIADVICLHCRGRTSRSALAEQLARLNPDWLARHAGAAARPDGDVELAETDDFVVPACGCGGVLKPDVVFFGENVPKDRVLRCYAAVEDLVPVDGALLVLGSSLTVMSGFRFVRHAAKLGVPVVIVTRGPTRADDLASYKVHHGTTEFLTELARRVVPARRVRPHAAGQVTSRRTESSTPSPASRAAYPVTTSAPAHQSR